MSNVVKKTVEERITIFILFMRGGSCLLSSLLLFFE
nr:MAG TPA: hypothetical protein [Caudoviricetes sp.]